MVLIRRAAPTEMDDLASFTVSDPVGSVDAGRFREEVAAGRMRPEWSWLAAGLLTHGHVDFGAMPDFSLVLRAGWRDEPAIAAAARWRADATGAAGLTDVVERLRYEWTPAAGVPRPSGRLVFRPGDDSEFLAVFMRAAVGSLDVATQRDLAAIGAESQARGDLDFYRSCPGERLWWRLAETPDGAKSGWSSRPLRG